jgi:hypothetical protein
MINKEGRQVENNNNRPMEARGEKNRKTGYDQKHERGRRVDDQTPQLYIISFC